MSQSDSPAGQPLFQNSDDQEQAYAPQQVPGNVRPASEEADAAADAGHAHANAEHVDASDGGNTATTPLVPVRPTTDVTTPLVVPAASAADRHDSSILPDDA